MSGKQMTNPHPMTEPCCWTPGMTEAEFFNANLRCGTPGFYPYKEFTREIRPLHIGADGRPGCGASSWRVFRVPWMHRGQRELVCLNCGAATEVEVPAWTEAASHA